MFLIVLKVVDVGSEILFHDSVKALSLSVGLWVVRGGELGLGSEDGTESLPELSDELRSSV